MIYRPGSFDLDSDGLTDREEETIYGTNLKDNDTDNDGFLDGLEVDLGFDPLDPDSFPRQPLPPVTNRSIAAIIQILLLEAE